MVIPVEESMIKRENFTPILSLVMVIYTTLCVLSGALGYLAFGNDTEVGRATKNSSRIVSSSYGPLTSSCVVVVADSPCAVRDLGVGYARSVPSKVLLSMGVGGGRLQPFARRTDHDLDDLDPILPL